MTYSAEELRNLLGQAADMPYGAARIALVEQVMGHADAQHLAELAFDARMHATIAYVYGGEPARSFVTFSWCLAEYDRDPQRYARWHHTLLWQFKSTVTGLTRFPEVPLDRTYAVLDDMERRWRENGHSLHAVYAHRHFVARHVGDVATAEEWYRKWCAAPRDSLSDCIGCDPSSKAYWLALRGRDEEAVVLAEPVLAGRLTCSEQPQGILTTLLSSYVRTGRMSQASEAHRRAYRLHRPHLADLGDIADHIVFCARTGNEARGLEILERHLGWLDRAPSPFAGMWFAAAGALVLRRALAAGQRLDPLRRPERGERPAGEVAAPALADELAATARATAAQFDARNGTGHIGQRISELLDGPPLVDHLPLSAAPGGRSVRRGPVASAAASARDPDRSAAGATPPPDATVVVVPPVESADDLLDLADSYIRQGRRTECHAIWSAFDERFAGADLTDLQRARRADGHGIAAAERGDFGEAETAWRSAEALFGTAGDEVRRQSTRARIGRVMCMTGRGDDGVPMVEEATSYLLAHGEPSRWAGAHYSLAIAYGEIGRIDDALTALDRADEFATSSLDITLPAVISIGRAQFLGTLGRFDEARAAAEEAGRRGRAAGFVDGVAQASFLAGLAAERLGDATAAEQAYADAVEAAAHEGLARQARMQRAGLLAASPRAAEVIDDLVEAVAQSTANGDADGAAQCRHLLALAYLNAGRPLDAAEVAEEAVPYFAAMGEPAGPLDAEVDGERLGRLIALRHLLAAAYQRLGQPNDAIEQLELIATACAAHDNPAGVGQMAEEIGDILDRQDRDTAAALRYLSAAEAFRAAELPVDEFRNRRQHATALLWSGDVPGALAALAVADEASLSLPDTDQARLERAMVRYDGARILRGADRAAEAAVRAASAAEAFRAIGSMLQAGYAEMLRAELLLSTGQSAEAEAAARRGLLDLPDGADVRARLEELRDAAIDAQRDGPIIG